MSLVEYFYTMKKIYFLLLWTLLLTSCGTSQDQDAVSEKKVIIERNYAIEWYNEKNTLSYRYGPEGYRSAVIDQILIEYWGSVGRGNDANGRGTSDASSSSSSSSSSFGNLSQNFGKKGNGGNGAVNTQNSGISLTKSDDPDALKDFGYDGLYYNQRDMLQSYPDQITNTTFWYYRGFKENHPTIFND